jgi:hypothetical protein
MKVMDEPIIITSNIDRKQIDLESSTAQLKTNMLVVENPPHVKINIETVYRNSVDKVKVKNKSFIKLMGQMRPNTVPFSEE